MDLNRIQGLFKTTTKIQDFFRIVRTVERVLAVRTCEKTWGGGGGNLAKGGWWQFPNGKYAFKFERFNRKRTQVHSDEIENCYCWRDKLNCVPHLLNKDTPCKLLILS